MSNLHEVVPTKVSRLSFFFEDTCPPRIEAFSDLSTMSIVHMFTWLQYCEGVIRLLNSKSVRTLIFDILRVLAAASVHNNGLVKTGGSFPIFLGTFFDAPKFTVRSQYSRGLPFEAHRSSSSAPDIEENHVQTRL
jgi:hypothetical protein